MCSSANTLSRGRKPKKNKEVKHKYKYKRNKCSNNNKTPAFHWNEFHINWPFHSSMNIWFGFFGFRALCGFNGSFYFLGHPKITWRNVLLLLLLFWIIQIAENRPRGINLGPNFWTGTFYLLLTISSLFVLINFFRISPFLCWSPSVVANA